MNAEHYIKSLGLEPHPEGGYYKEVYRASGSIEQNALPACFSGSRNYATSIYFLLKSGQYSAFHKIKQDEGWHFYAGTSLTLHLISPNGDYSHVVIGQNIDKGERFQYYVPAGYYFAAEINADDSFALVGCTVSPGFDFVDFDMPSKTRLLALFPHLGTIIARLALMDNEVLD